jgi:hypothetical protein
LRAEDMLATPNPFGLIGGQVREVTAAATVLVSDGVIRANTDSGTFAITIPRALGQAGGMKAVFIAKTGSGQIPLVLQDDLGAQLPLILINGGTAFALASVVGGVVTAHGVSS